MVEATDLKFGTWIKCVTYWLAEDKLPSKWALTASEKVLEFWDPSPLGFGAKPQQTNDLVHIGIKKQLWC